MSGGHLIVLDQAGRDSKRYSLPDGLATLGSDHSCDIRILLPTVSPHHATVVVRANQTLVRAVCGETLVNGATVSVAALRHGDVLALGGRRLRWEYRDAAASRPLEPEPALVVRARPLRSAGRRASASAAGGGAGARRERHLQLAAELASRASMPAGVGSGVLGKQVAIVQPQRRDAAGQQRDASPRTPGVARRSRAPGVPSPPPPPWGSPRQGSPRTPAPRRATPLRAAVLRRTLAPASHPASKARVTKIQAPTVMDHTKQAAFMLMMGHTPKGESPSSRRGSKRPSLPVGKRSLPVGKRSLPGGKRSIVAVKRSQSASPRVRPQAQPERSPSFRTSNRSAPSVVEITSSTLRPSDEGQRSVQRSPLTSSPPRSPKKSALKDPKSNARKIESIKFDLSNLENVSRRGSSEREEAESLHYSDSSPSPAAPSPPRRGRSLPRSPTPVPLPAPGSRPSLRAASGTTPASPRPRSTRPSRNLETYSIVDLVSIDSTDSKPTVYDSADSSVVSFGTPRPDGETRRSAAPALLASSTPYSERARRSGPAARSRSSFSARGSDATATGGRATRSKSLMTPENALAVPVPSGRVPRATKSRSRINESDLLRSDAEESSPLSSRRAGPVDDVAEDTFIESGETTPVLSIRSLIDSSREAPARGGRATRSEPRGGEQGRRWPVRRTLLRLSGEAPGEQESPGGRVARGGRRATPPRTVRPSPSPVKNKHSTAKKPVSKRPLLDHLERSDVVKTLFHSPVKRRLSRSMVEFSKMLTEDEEAPRKRARNTIAGAGRSGGGSSPARPAPASPPRTPVRHSGAGGGKRLFSPPTPHDDPGVGRGGRRSLRTPRPADGGRLAAASRRSEKISAPSPKNEYRNVSAQRKPRAPGNNLSDFRGVRELFRERRSPRNDLTDVGGVKRVFGRPPTDDLTDVGGVKRVFVRPPADDLTDVSGVGRLFDASDVFDRLLPAPRPASLRRSHTKRDYTRPARSLQVSLEQITDNVAQWVGAGRETPSEEFLAHRLPIKKRSLVVGGGGSEGPPPPPPLLPLKKRSLTHSTPLKGRGGGRGRGASAARVSPIPPPAPDAITMNEVSDIKSVEDKPKNEERKREAAVKPTPRKTRGRVKAGAAATAPAPAARPRRAARRGAADSSVAPPTKKRRVSLVLPKKPAVLSPRPVSPKPTRRGGGAPNPVPPALVTSPARRTRARRQPPAAPAADKPPTPKTTRAKASKTVTTHKASPLPKPKAQQTRRKAEPSPPVDITKPRPSRARRNNTNEPKSESTEPKNPPIEDQPKIKRGRKVVTPDINVDVPEPKTRRKRGTLDVNVDVPEPKTRRKRGTLDVNVDVPEPKTRRKRGTLDVNVDVPEPKTRRKRGTLDVNVDVPEPKTRRKRGTLDVNVDVPEPMTRRKRGTLDVNVDVSEPKTRRKRGKNTETEVAPPAVERGRKRKAVAEAPTPPKVGVVEAEGRAARGARGRAGAPAERAVAAGKAAESSEVEARPTRGRRAKVVVESEPKARVVRATRGGAAAGAPSPAKASAGRSRRR